MPKRGVDAEGAVSDEGFVVFSGSVGDAEDRSYLQKGARMRREQLREEGSIVADGNNVRFTKDVLFTSPSAAAVVVSGASYSGREVWKDESGNNLKVLEEQLAGPPDDPNESP